jgi:hypothetical protein
MWKALVQRRYSETAGALGLSLIYVVAALFFVAEPGSTIGSVSKWTNEMSGAFLSISSNGNATSTRQAKEDTANELFDLLVFKPWVVLDFGGLEHCVVAGTGSKDSDPESVAVRPLSSSPDRDAALARRLQSGTEITADGKVCVNNANKYAPRFLRYSLGADEHDERDKEYDALNDGDASDLPDAERSGYRLGVADKPATDAMEEGGQYQRLLLALVLFVGEFGAFLLLGSLSIGVILAQVLLLLLLAFSPVALIAAVIPGRGHDFFKGWLEKLAGYLLRKAAYSLILAVLLAVTGALSSATDQLGWLMSFGLQSLFFWAVFLQRKSLADSLIGIATGPKAPGRDASLKLLSIYAGGRIAGRLSRPLRRGARSMGGRADRLIGGAVGGGRGGSDRRRAPLFGTSHSRPVGDDAPPIEAAGSAQRPRPAASSTGKAGKGASASKAGASVGESAAGASVKGDSTKGAGGPKRPTGDQAAADPRRQDPRSEEKRQPARREGRQAAAGQPPVRRAGRSTQGEDSLGAELRAERERSQGSARKPPAEKQPDPRRDAPPPRRKRKRRKGGGR